MFVDPRTAASNAAGVRINIAHYLWCHPAELVFAALLIVGGAIGAAVVMHPALLIVSAAGAWLFFQGLMTARAKFRTGDVCPAVVVSDRPYRIAACTDLSTRGAGNRPAILIKRAPLSRMAGGPPALGQRLATVALYYGSLSDNAWKNFDPTVLACATRDAAAIARVTNSIATSKWRQLDALLARLPHRREGLYKLWIGTENQCVTGAKKGVLTAIVFLVLAVPVVAIVANAGKSNRHQSASADAPERSAPSTSRIRPQTVAPIQAPPAQLAPPAPLPPTASPAPTAGPAASRPFHPPLMRRRLSPPPPRSSATPAAPPSPKAPVSSPPPTSGPANAAAAYAVNQKVEAQEKSGRWSEATILKTNAGQYFVHYDGWSDAWDEWVTPARLRPRLPIGGEFAVGQQVDIFEKRVRWSPGVILKRDGARYFIHYDGWPDTWNEWVDAEQLRPRR
jgi:hypothetical protein